MKKALIVLCGSALLLVGLFSITLTAQPQSPRMAEMKAFAAKENDCVNAIKALPGIAEVSINAQGCSEWERNVWARRQIVSANIFVKSSGNRPLNQSIIDTIGLIVDATFDITDMDKIIIVDTVYNLAYNGAGEALPREPATMPPLPVINTASPGTTATPSSPALLSVDQDYIELLKKRVEVAQAELALLEAEVALRQHEASR